MKPLRRLSHTGGEKQALETEINQHREQIALITHGCNDVSGFDWAVEFAEVIAEGGFDIQVANPPYVRQELIREIKPNLKQVFPEVYTGTSDLYCFFYARSLQLLREGGMLAFISSNKWFRANYGEKLREHIAETCQVKSITDFGDLPVFENTSAYPMIFIAKKEIGVNNQPIRYTEVQSLNPPYPNVLNLIKQVGEPLPPKALDGKNWMLTDAETVKQIKKMEEVGTPLGEYVKGKIYYGIKTGFNQAFIIDGAKREELIAKDAKSSEIIKPLVSGNAIRKWNILEKDKWLIVAKIGVDIQQYPAIFNYLAKSESQLRKRSDQGDFWWELRACSYYRIFDQPKILFPDIAKETRFAWDINKSFTLNTTYMIPLNDLFLLGVLNSYWVKLFYNEISTKVRGGYLRFIRQYVEKIPIPPATEEQKSAIIQLAQKCIDAEGVNCEKWEQEIDEIVAGLYGL